MASKLKVEELRSQLSLRGLDTSGTKPVLVKRLAAAVGEEEKELESAKKKLKVEDVLEADGINASNKRKKDSHGKKPKNTYSYEQLQKMTIRQLRELASLHNIPDIGLKRELVERLFVIAGHSASNLKENNCTIGAVNDSSDIHDDKMSEAISTEKLQKMNMQQLRELATSRDIPNNGTKKELIERLSFDKHIGLKENIEENTCTTDAVNVSSDIQNDPLDDKMSKTTEKLQKMNIQQLRELAFSRHMPSNGTEKELIERLSADIRNDLKENVEAKLITATKKGGAVLDQWLPENIKTSFHVLQYGGEIYDATLNQTNVGQNNNKFYVIQALESDDGGKFWVYNRWGRVGVRGQHKLHGPYTSRDKAISEFEMKFFDKTNNNWSERKNFICYPRRYTWLEMDYDEAAKGTVEKKEASIDSLLRETKLETRIAKFVSLICNISMMKQQMMEIGYNAEKLPLGKLSKSTILKGYEILKRISDVISQHDRNILEQLTGEFYTVIPHDFGFRKMREFIIDTPYKLKCKLEMVATLGEIEIATKILKDDDEYGDDPLYSRYRQLHCDLFPVEAHSEEYSLIETYLRNTHAKTHSSYTVDIEQIFRVSKENESEYFSKFSNVKNKMLLWHGSRLTNWTGILSQGLRIAPPEAPSTGYMFGKGVYFADMFSKSANYCFATKDCTTGVLLLCEVALGDMSELLAADYNADQLSEGKLSTKGLGGTEPDMSEARALDDGVIVPLGKPKERKGHKGSLLYNEYIVYNVQQIRMRYIVQVNFKWN